MKITFKEWHAFLIGWGHGVCPKHIVTMFPMNLGGDSPLSDEYHHYSIGRGIGFITLLVTVGAIIGGLICLIQSID